MITLANIRRSVYNLFKRVEGIEEFLFQFVTDWADFKEEGIVANQAFPETWHKTGVLNNLIQDINADDAATTGKVYTATVSFNDLPSNMLQAELKVEIKEDSGKVILFTLISNETSPYYWLGISSYSGEVVWKSFLTEHQDISGKANSADLATVATTGDYEDLINKPSALSGKSAYDIAVDNGFEGTEQEWLASLKGEDGQLGLEGPAGQDGAPGRDGINGLDGAPGQDGHTPIITATKSNGVTTIKSDGTTIATINDGTNGTNGLNGQDGAPGLDGHSPVVTASKSGNTTTIYVDGTSIATIEDGQDGQNGTNGTNGSDGVTPHIDSTSKHWMIGSTDTGIVAEGQNGTNGTNGTNGQDGVTPHIDSTTGNWFIGTTDTGVHAQGPAGLDGSNGSNGSNGQDGHSPIITASKNNGVTTISVDGTPVATINDGLDGQSGQDGADGTNGTNGIDGVTPHIDSTTKHWMIGETDTGVVAEGLNVADPVTQSELEEVEKVTAIALTQLDKRVSDLETDSVATSSNYYDKSEIDLMFVNAASGGSVDLSGYVKTADLATVATSGDYNNLINKPTIPTIPSNETAASGGTTLSVVTTGEKYTWNNKSNFSGSYNDLTDKPTIPSAPDLTNYVLKSSTSGLLKNDGTVDTNTYLTLHQSLTDYVLKSLTSGLLKNDGTIDTSTYIETPVVDANNHNYVDLGLPSGTLWAKYNVGASSEADEGYYYMYGKGSTLYNSSDTNVLNADGLLSLSEDTAYQVMGGDWHMPTENQLNELLENTTHEFINHVNGATGYKFTGSNGNYIFLPFGAYVSNNTYDDYVGHYWSSNNTATGAIGLTLTATRVELSVFNSAFQSYGGHIRGVINSYPNSVVGKGVLPSTLCSDLNYASPLVVTDIYASKTDGNITLYPADDIRYLQLHTTSTSDFVYLFVGRSSTTNRHQCEGLIHMYNRNNGHVILMMDSGVASDILCKFSKGGNVITTGNYKTDYSIATIWRGTQAQYDLLTPDANTIYIITTS